MRMESYRTYYEYPSSQAAIHAIPSRISNHNNNNISPVKTKRSWSNILRIRSKKEKESISSPNATYSPGFNITPNGIYSSPPYSVQQNHHFLTSTPYGEITQRNYGHPLNQGRAPKFSNYNATCSRVSVNPFITSVTPVPRGTVKNTIRYTDWFGSVVAKKIPIRPALPLFQSAAALPGEGNLPAVTSWDNYVSIQNSPVALEIPLTLQSYGNLCLCPDQLFSTKGKKKKKCKNCGRKFATVTKHATAIGSVARIRPAIHPNLYQAPIASNWAWPQPTKNQYNQHYIAPVVTPKISTSPPHTPETIRSSCSSSNTLTPDNSSLIKTIPPAPRVPLPSIPKNKNLGHKDDAKRPSILEINHTTAYNLIEKDKTVSSDTDDLSDNAVDDNWDDFDKLRISSHEQNGGHRVSIISISGSEEINSNKVLIYTDGRTISNNLKEKDYKRSPKNGFSEIRGTHAIQSSISNSTPKKGNNTSSFQYNWDSSISSTRKINPSASSSHVQQRNKNRKSYNGIPERDSSKVINIAGQRILFEPKVSEKVPGHGQISSRNKENLPEIGDWEPLHEESFQKVVPDLITFSDNETSPQEVTEPDKKLERSEFSTNLRSSEKRWSVLSSDTIHEEDEEEQVEEEGKENEEDIREEEHTIQEPNFPQELEQDNEDKDTISSSSVESPIREEGFQPTLSELLQVKSILKRPNSLDTSSETDSDFYLPSFSEYKKNLRKKKSVQFRQSTDVTLVETETKGRKVNTLRNAKKEKKNTETVESAIEKERRDKYNSNWGLIDDVKPESQESSNDIIDPQEQLERETDELLKAIQKHFPDLKNIDIASKTQEKPKAEKSFDNKLSEKSGLKIPQPLLPKEHTTKLRRSSSQRETAEAIDVPFFNDTFCLRQPTNRPGIPKFDGMRRPIRKAPPPPRNPLRPSVPPPPPPICKDDDTNSTGSSSSTPPPLPNSQPPPVPSSSPPPLDDEVEGYIGNSELTFGSFKDPHSAVSISSRTLHITPVRNNDQMSDLLPPSDLGGSVFDLREKTPTATVRNRMKVASVPNLLAFQSSNGDSLSYQSASKSPARVTNSSNKNPNQRSSFLISMVDERDAEERLSDHIYEELPSLPSSPSGSNTNTPSPERSMFDGASKNEILEYLQDARKRVNIENEDVDDIGDMNTLRNVIETLGLEDEEERYDQDGTPLRYTEGRSSNRSSNSESSDNSGLILRSDKERLTSGEIERTDSGVGSETSKPNITIRRDSKVNVSSVGLKEGDLPPCDDCESPVEAKVTNSGLMYAPLACRRCTRRRTERKEILTEIMETEMKYGRDLRVMMDQFNRPMRVAGLLSKNQIDRIFLNIEDLVEHNHNFTIQIRDAYEIALDQGDEDLLTVNVAKLFLQATPMLHAFQMYCVRQGAASILLQTLEKDRELLRIFLKVSQMENTLLRRMNLHSFLMVPIQRVTKYPLLLARLYKTTPPSHPSREDCRRAREKIELYLQHINNETKETSPTKLWRRISMSVGNNSGILKWSPDPPDYDISIKLRAVTIEVLDWNAEEAFIVREGRLLCLPPESNNWTRRGRNLKMVSVQMVLVTQGRPNSTLEESIPEDGLITPRNLGIKEVAILAFKDHRLTKTALIRDPWLMSRSVVTWDADGESECFEITDLTTKETFIFKDRESVGTEEWFRSVQFHTLSVGSWRRRRKALANIMIYGARKSSYENR